MIKHHQVFKQIQSGEITFEEFDNYLSCLKASIRAEQDLKLSNAELRLKNATAMSNSYMQEFADRGLVYIPKLKT